MSILFLLASVTLPVFARNSGSIQLTSSRDSLPPDGKSYCTITAQVLDSDGAVAPDGTEISFSASLGTIEETATTSAGVARVRLTSPEISGAAVTVITATWANGSAVGRLEVKLADAKQAQSGPSFVTVEADDYLAYCGDYRTIAADGNVRIKMNGTTITAYKAQVKGDTGEIVAVGNGLGQRVIVTTASGKIECDELRTDSTARSIVCHSIRGGMTSQEVKLPDLDMGSATVTPYEREEFDLPDVYFSALTVTAKRLVLFPGDRVQAKNANIYVSGRKVTPFTIPYYSLLISGEMIDEGKEYLSVGTYGMEVNLPLYYSLTPRSSGAVLVRRGTTTGWSDYDVTPKWFVDVREKYNTDKSDGTLTLTEVSDNWGVQLNHAQQLGAKTNASLYVDYPQHRDLYTSFDINHSFGRLSASLGVDREDEEADDTTGLGAYNKLQFTGTLRTKAAQVGKLPVKYSTSLQLVTADEEYDSSTSTVDSVTRESRTTFNRRLSGNLNSDRLALAKTASLRLGLSTGYAWRDQTGALGAQGLSTQGTAILDWNPNKRNRVQFNYRYSDNANLSVIKTSLTEEEQEAQKKKFSQSEKGHHTLSMSWNMKSSDKFNFSLFAIKGLDYSSMNAYARAVYKFDDKWQLSARATFNTYDSYNSLTQRFYSVSYDDLELALTRSIWNREITAAWSKSDNKIILEFGAGSF